MSNVDEARSEYRYKRLLSVQHRSPSLRAIWKRAYGDDYPEEVMPFGFVTRWDIERLARELGVAAGDRFVDIGCGRGGPGLLVAKRTGATLLGIDIVAEALAHAEAMRATLGIDAASFRVGTFTNTGLEAESMDGAMSVDALWMVKDKRAAISEVARCVKRGGRFAFTTWETGAATSTSRCLATSGGLLDEAGFTVLGHEATPNWLDRQLAVYQGIVEHEDTLVGELGAEAMATLLLEARELPEVMRSKAQRVIIVAERRARP